ncbi:MAG TPA: hypothetical protein VMK05_09995 [Burkholderiales bacterium]|nr:hypothetical protein [Burkholderiales bacterium]
MEMVESDSGPVLPFGLGLVLYAQAFNARPDDVEAARTIKSTLKLLAAWDVEEDRVLCRWGPGWQPADESARCAIMQGAVNADACLTGRQRKMFFYSPDGVLVGVSTPESGLIRIRQPQP